MGVGLGSRPTQKKAATSEHGSDGADGIPVWGLSCVPGRDRERYRTDEATRKPIQQTPVFFPPLFRGETLLCSAYQLRQSKLLKACCQAGLSNLEWLSDCDSRLKSGRMEVIECVRGS